MPIQVSTASWVLNGLRACSCAHAALRMQLCPCSCAHAAVRMQLAATDALELSQRVQGLWNSFNTRLRCSTRSSRSRRARFTFIREIRLGRIGSISFTGFAPNACANSTMLINQYCVQRGAFGPLEHRDYPCSLAVATGSFSRCWRHLLVAVDFLTATGCSETRPIARP